MEIKRAGSQSSVQGPVGWFTGTVRIDPLLSAHDRAWRRGLVSAAKSTGTGPPPTTALTNIAIQEQLDGKGVDWLGKVTGEQYQFR